jgi:hypothetical protein
MSDRAKNLNRQTEDLEPEQTRESTKRTVATQLAPRRKKIYEDASFRRPSRGRTYLEVPREENPGPIYELTYKEWYSRQHSRAASEDKRPAWKPFFVGPPALTRHYLHQRVYEARLYNTLSAGGTRIAFIGEAGVGYGISACIYLTHLTQSLGNHNSRCKSYSGQKKNDQRRMCCGFPQTKYRAYKKASVL